MWYIIIGLIVLGIIFSIVESLADMVGGMGPLIAIVAVLVIAFLAFSWAGVFAVISIAIVGIIIIALLRKAGIFIRKTIKEHDESARKTAKIKQDTQNEKLTHDNDKALYEELNKNCYWLGHMNQDSWKRKLPNYVGKKYTSSFESITQNFAKQIEQQYILQNNDWFEPYKLYVLNHPGGATVTKMLNEVNCPQLKMTHCTPDGDLINTWLVRGTKRVSKDVPELFRMTFIRDINENVFTPTEYLKKLYGCSETDSSDSHVEELNFDDL